VPHPKIRDEKELMKFRNTGVVSYYRRGNKTLESRIVQIRTKTEKFSCLDRILYFAYKLFKYFYTVVYYYFLPFTVFIISYYTAAKFAREIFTLYSSCRG